MYKYKFIRLESSILSNRPQDEYQKIIISHAEKGWRFKQIFAPTASGETPYYELIFEKETEKS